MTNDVAPSLHISDLYRKWLKEKKGDKQTREFLANNIATTAADRIDRQRKSRRSCASSARRRLPSRDFFDRGPSSSSACR